MSDKDQIYDLFRRSEHNLDEQPSRRAWERIDARLDRHEVKGIRPVWYKYGGMVAAVLILVSAASIFTIQTQGNNANTAMAEDAAWMELQDLKQEGNHDDFSRIVAYQKAYENRANRFTERNVAGVLKPKGQKGIIPKTYKDEEEGNYFANADIKANTSDEYIVKENTSNFIEEPFVKMDDEPIAMIEETATLVPEGIDVVQNMTTIEETAIAETMEEADVEKAELEEDLLAENRMKDEEVRIASAKKESTSKTRASGNADYDAGMVIAEEVVASPTVADAAVPSPSVEYDMNADDVYPGMAADKESEDNGLVAFDWLVGNWNGNVNGSESNEKWSRINADTYQGKASLTAGGVTLFTEKIIIKKIDEAVYLTITLGAKKKKIAYRLVSDEGNSFVFKNTSVDFPKQIILQRISANSYSLTMEIGAAEKLTDDQVDYLKNRNDVVGDKLIRSLKKVN